MPSRQIPIVDTLKGTCKLPLTRLSPKLLRTKFNFECLFIASSSLNIVILYIQQTNSAYWVVGMFLREELKSSLDVKLGQATHARNLTKKFQFYYNARISTELRNVKTGAHFIYVALSSFSLNLQQRTTQCALNVSWVVVPGWWSPGWWSL